MPWLGYFDKINKADVFVLLDHVQFTKGSWINRNRIKAQNAELMISIPVRKKGLNMSILETQIDNSNPKWIKKHLDSLRFAYQKAPRFELIYPELERLYLAAGESLADFDIEIIRWVCEFLEFDTRLIRSSQLPVGGAKTELLANICDLFHAETYIIGMGGNNLYMDYGLFEERRITVEQQSFRHPYYGQIGDTFISGLSIVDLLFSYGKGSRDFFNKIK
jgi:hypothetical protein